ncbi:hypothetical protein [Bizionia arctica]|uniref:DUF695 domain-containing protein n=1 Tax=Bizionia arctica TaxID=1495645 RepID=A0A917LS31_9FLAO|nr:hypothetical protein [Bizionia arctica]GGG53236.1 hypothetical protein GCM10010976_25340 [Bizionia arctica]
MAQLKDFWDWFLEYHEAIYYLRDFTLEEQAFYYQELDDRLQDYHPDLTYVIAFPKKDKKAILTLTANGSKDAMLFVSQLASVAPKIPKWKVKKILQAQLSIKAITKGKDDPYEFEEFPIKPSDLRWIPMHREADHDPCDLIFHLTSFPNINPPMDEEKLLIYIHFILLDLLGELVVSKAIGAGYYMDTLEPDDEWFTLDFLPMYLEGEGFDV